MDWEMFQAILLMVVSGILLYEVWHVAQLQAEKRTLRRQVHDIKAQLYDVTLRLDDLGPPLLCEKCGAKRSRLANFCQRCGFHPIITPETSAIMCEHANEMPHVCPCPPNCYCKSHSCKTGLHIPGA